MKREGVQQDGDGWVVVWDCDDHRWLFEIWTCRFCYNNIFPFPVCMGQKLGDFLQNREHAPKTLAWLGETDRTKKNLRNKNFELLTHRIGSVSPDDAVGYRSVNILARGCSLCE